MTHPSWKFPPDRPWIEFAILLILASISAASLAFFAVRHEQLTTLNRRQLDALDEYNGQFNKSLLVRTKLIIRIGRQVGVPQAEMDEILAEDPTYRPGDGR
jgi:hypothetical protein